VSAAVRVARRRAGVWVREATVAIAKSIYRCQQCGHISTKWLGKCPQCLAWNCFHQEPAPGAKSPPATPGRSERRPRSIEDIPALGEARIVSGIDEWDRVLGGGLVPGSLVLIAGDPGIGKSTLLLQITATLSAEHAVLYVSGEESPRQLKLRATRLGLRAPELMIYTETSLDAILATVAAQGPKILAIDSIQTLHSGTLEAAPGSVGQVRECASALMAVAKDSGIGMFIIGHVTKEGVVAGPRVLEHMVDTVLYLEGDRSHTFRLLRAVKNRFGSTNEIGVFEMKEGGLDPVANPSKLLLAERPVGVAGSVVACSIEGTRPLLVELQALVSQSNLTQPRRMSIGIDGNRLSLLLAVLEKKLGFNFAQQDVFVNVAGGLRLLEPAVDLAVIVALVSSYLEQPVADDLVVWGEVGLAGEVRGVGHAAQRISEARKLGFGSHLIPKTNADQLRRDPDLAVTAVRSVQELVQLLFR